MEFIEKFTECDVCEHLQECKENHLVWDITVRFDTTRHFIPDMFEGCPRKDDKNDRENV